MTSIPTRSVLPNISLRWSAGSLLAVLLAAALPASAAGQDRAQAALQGAAERYRGLTTLCADFHQVLTVTLLGERTESRGELCQRRPNLFFMRFTQPAGDEVVADGTFFWVYYRSVNPDQVVKLPLDPSRGGLDFYREFLEEPEEKYVATLEGEEVVAGRSTLRIHLQPRAPRGYRSARVWIDPEARMIRRVEIVEENGTVRLLTLESLRVDPPVPPAAFDFQLPPGVSVFTGGGW